MTNPVTNKKILVIGGSGFLSGAVVQQALATGDQVWTITRGQRTLPAGVTNLIADRKDQTAFEQTIQAADTHWDLVVDCIAYQPADIEQDVAVFSSRAVHLVFVSTDFVYDPARREFPQGEESEHYLSGAYGGGKREAELALIESDTGEMAWTIVRPCHIYGPGSQLGCLPEHSRDRELIARLRAGEALKLVGGGYFLQQPILARDLADTILSLPGNDKTYGQIFCTAGPDTVESWVYYQLIADILGVSLTVEEIPVRSYLAENPGRASFLCHRVYDLSKLRASGASVPATPLAAGLREQVEDLLSRYK